MRPNPFLGLLVVIGSSSIAWTLIRVDTPDGSTQIGDPVLAATIGNDLGTYAASGNDVCAALNSGPSILAPQACSDPANAGQDRVGCQGAAAYLSGSSLGGGSNVTMITGVPGGSPPITYACNTFNISVGTCIGGVCAVPFGGNTPCPVGNYPPYAAELGSGINP